MGVPDELIKTLIELGDPDGEVAIAYGSKNAFVISLARTTWLKLGQYSKS